MPNDPPSLISPARREKPAAADDGLALSLTTAVLTAQKEGALAALLRQRPLATRWFGRRLLRPLRALAGNALPADALDSTAWLLLLRASLARLRPDGKPGLEGIGEAAWRRQTAWRPLLALACHFGALPVPQFKDAYRPRSEETAAQQLCGLWDVGTSTFYRHLDKGRSLLAAVVFDQGGPATGTAARDACLQHELYVWLGLAGEDERGRWHARQAALSLSEHAAPAALRHSLLAGDGTGFLHCLHRYRVELAAHADTDAQTKAFAAQPMGTRQRVRLWLALAGIAQVRGQLQAEQQAHDEALRVATAAQDRLMLGTVYGALGKFNEMRDTERAFACYQESAEFLRQAGGLDDPASADAEVLAETLRTLCRLAFLYLMRNDPRCKAVLDQADALRPHCQPHTEELAMLEQIWGEYWRRNDELQRALEHKHRALHIYERLGDRQSVLKTHVNLALIYSDARNYARALEHSQKVLDAAERYGVEPEMLAATHLHLGATRLGQGKYDLAIEHFQHALEVAHQGGLRTLVGRAHYNLAEAYYKRFLALDRSDDEGLGDAHTAAALAVWPETGDAGAAEATRSLKGEVLGPRDGMLYDRLLPGEFAAHFDEMTQVQRQRAALAGALAPADQVQAQLTIASAYLGIAVKERELAVALMRRHGLAEHYAPALARLHQVFERNLSREDLLSAAWRNGAGDLLAPAAARAVLQHLLRQGWVSKSVYAQVCDVGLSTASKHLNRLVQKGLLVRIGNGPGTRYEPATSAPPVAARQVS